MRRALTGGLGQSLGSSIEGHCMQTTHTGGACGSKNEIGVGKKRPILAYNSLRGPRSVNDKTGLAKEIYFFLQHMGEAAYAHRCTHGGGLGLISLCSGEKCQRFGLLRKKLNLQTER
jgi:hypothetical protein